MAAQLAVAIAGAAQQRTTRLTVALAPQDLGGVQITLEFGRDRRLKAAIRVDRPDTLKLIQTDAQSVVRSLESAGFDLGAAGLQLELSGQGDGRRQSPLAAFDPPSPSAAVAGIGTAVQPGSSARLLRALDLTV